jgi:hypothetical protein
MLQSFNHRASPSLGLRISENFAVTNAKLAFTHSLSACLFLMYPTLASAARETARGHAGRDQESENAAGTELHEVERI